MALTQAQIDAAEKLRIGFWQRITGAGENDNLQLLQYQLLGLQVISDQLARLAGASGSSGLPQPLPNPVQPIGSPVTALVAQAFVPFTVKQVDDSTPFGGFTAPYDGSFVLGISMSAGGIITANQEDSTGKQVSSPLLFSGNNIGTNLATSEQQPMQKDMRFSFQSDTAGTASFLVICWPGL